MTLETFGDRLRKHRKRLGLRQHEMSTMLCVSNTTYANYERGKSLPTIDLLATMSDTFKVSIDELVRGKSYEG